MNFCSVIYLVFLAVVFLGYWSIRLRGPQNWLLIIAGFVFYGWWDWRFCALLLISPCIDYYNGRLIGTSRNPLVRITALVFSVTYSIALLSFFKYSAFLSRVAADGLALVGVPLRPLSFEIILPLGISFYLFQSLGYVIDVYRGAIPPCRSLRDYLAFVVFFPQMVAGPIERASHLLAEIQRDRKFDPSAAADGCRQMLWGFWKKMFVADNLAAMVEPAYSQPESYGGLRLVLATVFFAFQIYCDFSGYSDIAVGTGKLFGISLMRNFRCPYFALDPADFWRRWHISLSQWFRDYVFVPLGGSRGSRYTTARNVLITFVISGLWHGAGYSFLTWGLLNGILVIPFILKPKTNAAVPRSPMANTGPLVAVWSVAKVVATFMAICATWVFFRSPTASQAWLMLCRMCTDPSLGSRTLFVGGGPFGERKMIIAICALVFCEWMTRDAEHPLSGLDRLPRIARWTVYTTIVFMILYGLPSETSSFIYFQF